MPTVTVVRDDLFALLGENFGANKPNVPCKEADDKFDELCFAFGIELDDVTTEKDMKVKETGSADSSASEDIVYKIEVPANRYDLLCLEGLVRALRVYLNKDKPPTYKIVHDKQRPLEKMIVSSEVKRIRPFVVCAILRNVTFNQKSYQSFIDLQEKLHQNICRRRTLVSIGTHDLDTIKGPFTYEALPPKEIKFAPLNNTKVMDGEELMKHLDKDLHLRKYLPIIRDSPVYPVIYDSNRVVLSLPPIINGNHSKITLNTKNVFIEVTATDLTKAEIVLNTMCAMFSEYCADKYSVEPVEVVDADGKTHVWPDMSTRQMEADIDYIVSSVGGGPDLNADSVAKLLTQMSLSGKLTGDKKKVQVEVPVTRSDILHACDIMEDVAIAYGFTKITPTVPKTVTVGKQQPLNKLSDLLRLEVAMAGYTEVLNMALCSREETFNFLNRPDDGSAVTIANPQTAEFQVARTSLLVGILKTASNSRKMPLPIRVFEVSDIVLKDNQTDVGARNRRNLCALYCAHTAGFEIIHGLLDRIMIALGAKWKEQGKDDNNNNKNEVSKHGPTHWYHIKPSEDPAFFPGRRADVIVDGNKVGVLGIVHPDVLAHYHIPFPCSALEICIEPFL